MAAQKILRINATNVRHSIRYFWPQNTLLGIFGAQSVLVDVNELESAIGLCSLFLDPPLWIFNWIPVSHTPRHQAGSYLRISCYESFEFAKVGISYLGDGSIAGWRYNYGSKGFKPPPPVFSPAPTEFLARNSI